MRETPDYSAMLSCPFPIPEDIHPCACLVDTEQFHTHLVCNMQQDFTVEILTNISEAYGCEKKVDNIDINMNGYQWAVNFSSDLIGEFEIRSFHLRNFSSISGNIQHEAFNASKSSLLSFVLEPADEDNVDQDQELEDNSVERGAFSGLINLGKVILGHSFTKIEGGGFSNLPRLKTLEISKKTLKGIGSGAFENLGALNIIDFSDQLLEEIPARAFKTLPNTTSIDLSGNKIRIIVDDAFIDLPNLVKLDLSNNTFCQFGNLLTTLKNQKLKVDLSENKVQYILEDIFKPFIETSKGHVDLRNNPLQCRCDVRWLLLSNFAWRNLLANTACRDGDSLEKVNVNVLEKICPKESCGKYNAEYGRMYQKSEKKVDYISSPNYPRNYPYSGTKTWTLTGGKMKIKFLGFSTRPSYDYIIITDNNGSELLRHSGSSLPRSVTSVSDTVRVQFVTQYSSRNRYSGWKLEYEYEAQNTDPAQFCQI